jgi:hypothetical protein
MPEHIEIYGCSILNNASEDDHIGKTVGTLNSEGRLIVVIYVLWEGTYEIYMG